MEPTEICRFVLLVIVIKMTKSEVGKQSIMTYVSPGGLTCIKCYPGTYLVEHCKENNVSSKCVFCPSGTFSSTPNQALSCAPCRTYCLSKSTVPVKQCSPTSDMICACPNGTHNKYPHFPEEHVICTRDDPCPVGHGVVHTDPSKGIIVCEECVASKTFSPTISPINRCEACTLCDEGMNLTECTTTSDRECKQGNHSLIYEKAHEEGFDVNIIIIVVVLFITVAMICVVILACYLNRRSNDSDEKPPLEDIFTTSESSEHPQNVLIPREGMLPNSASVEKSSEINGPTAMIYEKNPGFTGKPSEPQHGLYSMTLYNEQSTNSGCNFTSSSAHTLQPCTFKTDNEVERKFPKISYIIKCDWKVVMRHVLTESGVDDFEEVVRTIDMDYEGKGEQEKAYQCLVKWKQLVHRSVRLEMIINALRFHNMNNTISAFEKEFSTVFVDRPGEETM